MKIYNQPQVSFGMAWKFDKGGANRMAAAFSEVPNAAKNIVRNVQEMRDVEVVAGARDVNVSPLKYRELLCDFLQEQSNARKDERIAQLATCDEAERNILSLQEPYLAAEKTARIVQNKIDELDENIGDLASELEHLAEPSVVQI